MHLHAEGGEEEPHILLLCLGMLLDESLHGLFAGLGDFRWPANGLQLGFVDRAIVQKVLFDVVDSRATAADFPGNVFCLPFVQEQADYPEALFVGEMVRHRCKNI